VRSIALALGLVACAAACRAPVAANEGARRPSELRALLVVHPLDRDGHAYILACVRRDHGATTRIDARTCAPLLRDVRLELAADGKRVPVTAGAIGVGYPCPDGEPHEPFVRVSGLPPDVDRGFVVTAGMVEVAPDDAMLATILAKHGPFPDKRPRSMQHPERVPVAATFDIDGDGVADVVTERLGGYALYDAAGEVISTIGCVYG
jgi:hypothetical protein